MSEGLKPCPFCGGRAEMRPKSGYWCERSGDWIDPKPFCSVCRATAPDRVFTYEPTAAQRWNMRVGQTESREGNPEASWPIGCIKRSACARHKACVYGNSGSCTHATRSIAAEVEKASEIGR